jgi:hypothetical protein
MNLLGRWPPSFGLHRRDEERVEHRRAHLVLAVLLSLIIGSPAWEA